MNKLDDIALNIELVLISIIEGVALVKLAENSVPYLHDWHSLQYLPYILSGLTILLVFWAQAILHAVSFIRWPLKMEHMFLYFVAGFLQVVAYTHIDSATGWFFWWTVFSLVALFTYVVDLRIIRASVRSGAEYLREVERRHLQELKYLVPTALAFNVLAFLAAYLYPEVFSQPLAFALLGTLQCVVSLAALYDCVRNFGLRSNALSGVFTA